MDILNLPIKHLREAPWNPNHMDRLMLVRLQESIRRFGLVENLVVRPLGNGSYEVLSGNQRLAVLRELGMKAVPCVVLSLEDTHARLLAQALNHIRGEDDLGLRAELLRSLSGTIPLENILALLPETRESLAALASLGQQEMASYLAAYQRAQAARLKHLQVQLTEAQLEVVEEALGRFLPEVSPGDGGNPNRRGLALFRLCEAFLKLEGATQ